MSDLSDKIKEGLARIEALTAEMELCSKEADELNLQSRAATAKRLVLKKEREAIIAVVGHHKILNATEIALQEAQKAQKEAEAKNAEATKLKADLEAKIADVEKAEAARVAAAEKKE